MASSVSNTHIKFNNNYYLWKRVRDAIAPGGLKRNEYLPIPSAAVAGDVPPPSAPNRMGRNYRLNDSDDFADALYMYSPDYHYLPSQESMKTIARAPDLVSSTVAGFYGIYQENPHEFTLPTQYRYLLDNATPDGDPLSYLVDQIFVNIIKFGRVSVAIDVKSDNTFTFVLYDALSFTNWREGKVDGQKAPVMAVFRERVSGVEIPDKEQDRFDTSPVTVHRVLELERATASTSSSTTTDTASDTSSAPALSSDTYFTEVFLDGESQGVVVPEYQGRSMSTIPMVTFGSTSLDLQPDKIPMLGLADIAVQMYQKDANLSQAQYLSCNPMLTLIGADETETPKAVGSNVVVRITDPTGKAQYTEPRATCLDNVRQSINDLRAEAAHYGSAILGSDKRGSESAEALRLRKSASTATLSGMTKILVRGVNKLLDMVANWAGDDPSKFNFYMSSDYAGLPLTAKDRAQLVSEWQSGLISKETVRHNLREAKVIPENVTDEQIESQLKKEGFVPPAPAQNSTSSPATNFSPPSTTPTGTDREDSDHSDQQSDEE